MCYFIGPSRRPRVPILRDRAAKPGARGQVLFADAEPAEDHAEQIVGGEFAGDRRERRAARSRNSSAKSSSGGGLVSSCAAAAQVRRRRRAARANAARARETCPPCPPALRRRQASPRAEDRRPAPVLAESQTSAAPSRLAERFASRPGQIDLVANDDPRAAPAGKRATIAASPRRARLARVGDDQAPDRRARSRPRSARCRCARSRAPSRKPAVSMMCSGMPPISIAAADRVARRAGMRRHDRDLVAGELVQQARLADVGLADQHDVEPFAQEAALPRARRRSPRVARAVARACRAASAARMNSMSSSGKSSVASVNMRSSISSSTSALDLAPRTRRSGCAPPRAPRSSSRRRSGRRRPRPAPGRACR